LGQIVKLVVGESLGGIEVQGPRIGVLRNLLENGKVVAQRLAGSRGRHNNGIVPPLNRRERLGLVRIQLTDASVGQHGLDRRMQHRRQIHQPRFARRNVVITGDRGVLLQFGKVFGNGGRRP
jgi:hypothetical protein